MTTTDRPVALKFPKSRKVPVARKRARGVRDDGPILLPLAYVPTKLSCVFRLPGLPPLRFTEEHWELAHEDACAGPRFDIPFRPEHVVVFRLVNPTTGDVAYPAPEV